MDIYSKSIDRFIDDLIDSPLFKGMSMDEIESVLNRSSFEIIRMNTGEELTVRLEKSIFILKGAMATYHLNESGRKSFINYFTPEENSLMPVIDKLKLVSLAVVAKKPSLILLLETDFFASLNKEPLLLQNKLQSNIIHIFYRMTENIVLRTMCNSETQARDKILKYISHRRRDDKTDIVKIEYTWGDLANHLLVDISTLMRELKKLKEDGIIDYGKKKIVVKKPEALPSVVEYKDLEGE